MTLHTLLIILLLLPVSIPVRPVRANTRSIFGAWFFEPASSTPECATWFPRQINAIQCSSHAALAPVQEGTGALVGIPTYCDVSEVQVSGSRYGVELSLVFSLQVHGLLASCTGMTFNDMTHFNGSCAVGRTKCHFQYRCESASCSYNLAPQEGAFGNTPVTDGLWNTSDSSTCLDVHPPISSQFWMYQFGGYGIVRPSNPYQGTNTYSLVGPKRAGTVYVNTMLGSNTTCELRKVHKNMLYGICHIGGPSGNHTSCALRLVCVGGACLE